MKVGSESRRGHTEYSMVKLLVVGDVCGNLDTMYNKATAVNSKHGPFDAILCVGDFLGTDEAALAPYTSGEKKGVLPSESCD